LFLCRSPATVEVSKPLLLLDTTGVKMNFSKNSDVDLSYPVGTHIDNGKWHYVALSLEDNEVTVYLDGIIGSSAKFTPVEPM